MLHETIVPKFGMLTPKKDGKYGEIELQKALKDNFKF